MFPRKSDLGEEGQVVKFPVSGCGRGRIGLGPQYTSQQTRP